MEFCTALWNTYSYVSRKLYKQLEVSPIGFHPKVVHLSCCLWTSSIPWTLLVSWRYTVQVYSPFVHLTHWTKQLYVKVKIACTNNCSLQWKTLKQISVTEWLPVSEFVSANAGDRQGDNAPAGCVVGLGLLRYSQALLHTSQVYEYIQRTKITNLLLWLMCFRWLPSLPHFFIGGVVGPTFCSLMYLPKYPYHLWEIKGYGVLMVSVALYSCNIWPQCEAVPKLQLVVSRDSTRQSLSACYDNASSVQVTLHWIPVIWSFCGASPSPSTNPYLPAQGVLWANC